MHKDPIARAAETLRTISTLAEDERDRLLLERPELAGELLTPAEVMAALRIGRTRYQDLVASGELASVKPGRIRLVIASDLRRWIREKGA
jgi:excisionase family DNA binding protein